MSQEKVVEHKDFLGYPILQGDFVIARSYKTFDRSLKVYQVKKLTKNMLRLVSLYGDQKNDNYCYPKETIKILDERLVTMIILKGDN